MASTTELPVRASAMCQSYTSVPRTYIRAAHNDDGGGFVEEDLLLDVPPSLSATNRLASLPSLSCNSPHYLSQQHNGINGRPYPVHHHSIASPSHHNFDYRQPSPRLSFALAGSATAGSQTQLHHHQQQQQYVPPKALVTMTTMRPPPTARISGQNLDELAPLAAAAPVDVNVMGIPADENGGKSPPGTGLLSKCVLCLLLNAIFVLALFLAFLIGHFAAEAHLPANRTNSSGAKVMPSHSSASSSLTAFTPLPMAAKFKNGTQTAYGNNQQQNPETHEHKNSEEEDERRKLKELRKNVERSRQRVLSLREVYPPQLDSIDEGASSDAGAGDGYATSWDGGNNGGGGGPAIMLLPWLFPSSSSTRSSPLLSDQLGGNGPLVHHRAAHHSLLSAGAGTKLLTRPNAALIALPRHVTPRHYNLDLDLTEFYGVVEPPQVRANQSILLEAFGNGTGADDELVFHAAANIFLQRIQLFCQTAVGKQAMEIRSVRRHAERELVRLMLSERLRAGWYWLEMEYRTRICQTDSPDEGIHCFPGAPIYATSSAFGGDNKATEGQAEVHDDDQQQHPVRQVMAGFASKFEPNLARTFLPGWDEPRFRSTFNVTIRHFADTRVLTNTAPIESYDDADAKHHMPGMPFGTKQQNNSNNQSQSPSSLVRITRYATTPPMPLYLLAFATGQFSPLEVRTNRGNVTLNVWCAPQDALTAHFVANFSPVMFDRLHEDFVAKYPLNKMDIFLTPKFPVGGMENWGLIVLHTDTVRLAIAGDGTLPLTQSATNGGHRISAGSAATSKEQRARAQQQHALVAVDRRAERYRVEKVITHELVHQWFGNLVSICDWEELWLSEGFASYFVFDFLNALNHPHMTEHEYYMRLSELILRQSMDGRSALVRPLRSTRQLERVFDGVQLYTKGAVMVKMLKDLVGPAEFRVGISRFLRENAFQCVDRRALWAAFPARADHGADPVRLRDALEPWLLNRGVPEVEITRAYAEQAIRLEQRPADRNKHLVYLDDEGMQRMRVELKMGDNDGGGGNAGRNRRRKRRRPKVERQKRAASAFDGRRRRRITHEEDKATEPEVYTERDQQTALDDIDGILHWMQEEQMATAKNVMEAQGQENGTNGMNRTETTATKFSEETGGTEEEQEATASLLPIAQSTEAFDESMFDGTNDPIRVEDMAGKKKLRPQHNKLNNEAHRKKTAASKQRGGGGTHKKHNKHRGHKQQQQRQREWHEQRTQQQQDEMDPTAPPPVFSTPRWWSSRAADYNNANFDGQKQQAGEENGKIRFLPTAPTSSLDELDDDDEAKVHRQHRAHSNEDGIHRLGPLWPIPFSYTFGSVRSARGQTVRQFWLLNDTVRFVDVGLAPDHLLLANPHWVYAYRVNYDVHNWRMLIAQLHKNHQEIPAMSRLQLIVDAECYLRESAHPELFVHLLSYLTREDDLGVLLAGLDALHSLLELFAASEVFGPMLVHFLPVIRQLDRQLAMAAAATTTTTKATSSMEEEENNGGADDDGIAGGSAMNTELAALWLLQPQRLAKLYQMRCAANLGTCAESRQVRKWLAHPMALAGDNHQQLAAICQHLFTHAGSAEVHLLSGLLQQPHSVHFAALLRQLASRCVQQDEQLMRQAVGDILRTRNAILYSTALNNAYTIHYNRKFRQLFWTGLAHQLNIHERQVLFAVNTGKSDRMARVLLHSIRSLGELNLVERVVLQQWPQSLRVQMEYLRRKLSWTEREATEKIRKYLIANGSRM